MPDFTSHIHGTTARPHTLSTPTRTDGTPRHAPGDETRAWPSGQTPTDSLTANAGHTTDLHTARFAQPMNQLIAVLESYQAVMRHTEA
ncbi:hypothetical protein ACFVT2_32545 [Streptomyces sp. NPDC058000]|uniref:hypothetical protein n=1 Tax=Streptomyces sp. NPDC058000 TaxID=3346299 RepID=UPI0036EA3AA2